MCIAKVLGLGLGGFILGRGLLIGGRDYTVLVEHIIYEPVTSEREKALYLRSIATHQLLHFARQSVGGNKREQ